MTPAQALTLLAFLSAASLFILANYGEKYRHLRALSLALMGLLSGAAFLLGALAAALAVLQAQLGTVSAAQFRSTESFLVPLMIAGGLGLLYLVPSVQLQVARWVPLRPGSPVHYTAVVLAVLFLGLQLGTQLAVDVLSTLAAGPAITEADLLVQEIPLFVLAFVGVGLFVRRPLGETMGRLGLTAPRSAWWWLVALLAIALFYGVAFGIDRAADALSPGTQKRVSDVSNVLFRQFNNPGSILLLGTAAGIGEEVLFRGAMLPRFGVLITALFFAGVHTQYGITFASLEVFVLGVMLGWLRLRAGTLACILTHAGYDVTVGFVGLLH